MTDYPDLCNDEPACCKPELEQRIAELETKLARVEAVCLGDTGYINYYLDVQEALNQQEQSDEKQPDVSRAS